jgi:hypothetical protein
MSEPSWIGDLIDEFGRGRVDEPVFRLMLPVRNRSSDLRRRGIRPDAIEETRAALEAVGIPETFDQAISARFNRVAGQSPPFGKGRYGDGANYGVFYAALEEMTSVEEVRFHLRQSMAEDGLPQNRQMIVCRFEGLMMFVTGSEEAHPELTSQDESGYTYCQALGAAARADGVDGLHAPSARRPGGTCAPVFSRAAVSEPKHKYYVRFIPDGSEIATKIADREE